MNDYVYKSPFENNGLPDMMALQRLASESGANAVEQAAKAHVKVTGYRNIGDDRIAKSNKESLPFTNDTKLMTVRAADLLDEAAGNSVPQSSPAKSRNVAA